MDRWRRLHLDVPSGVTLRPCRTSLKQERAAASRSSPPGMLAGHRIDYQRAGAHVREVQRMTLEEIFVANVMSNRRSRRHDRLTRPPVDPARSLPDAMAGHRRSHRWRGLIAVMPLSVCARMSVASLSSA